MTRSKLVGEVGNAELASTLATHAALAANSSHKVVVHLHGPIKGVKRWAGGVLVAEYVALEPPWGDCEALVSHVRSSRHRKNIVEFFQSALLGLRHKQEDHEECRDVECGIEAEGT